MNKIIHLINNLFEKARNNPDLKPLADLYSKFDAPEDKKPRYKR